MKLTFFILIFLYASIALHSPDTFNTLDHADFLIWKTIHDPQISADGMTAIYRLAPGEGDPQLIVCSKTDSSYFAIPRVSRSNMDYAGKIIFCLITPSSIRICQLTSKKVEKQDR